MRSMHVRLHMHSVDPHPAAAAFFRRSSRPSEAAVSGLAGARTQTAAPSLIAELLSCGLIVGQQAPLGAERRHAERGVVAKFGVLFWVSLARGVMSVVLRLVNRFIAWKCRRSWGREAVVRLARGLVASPLRGRGRARPVISRPR